MNCLQPQSRQMKTVGLALAVCACIALICSNASAQLAQNQTNSFGNNRLVTFTYLQNFDCVDQPKLDLDFNWREHQTHGPPLRVRSDVLGRQ